ncbi:MAG: DUF192 domain-containing protein [Actinomycetota bacterium]
MTAPPQGALVSFGDEVVAAEIADEREEWSRGLMFRERLDPDSGMIFLFDRRRPAGNGFYMKNTLIPLSIAYMLRTGEGVFEIVAIKDMAPCPAETLTCPTYPPGAAYDAALEVNKGWFEAAGVEVGDDARVEE